MSTDQLAASAPPRLFGREHHLATLRALVARTRDSHGGLALVVGEAGIGKTALVAEALDPLRDEVLVVSGAAWEREGAPGYWPWLQVVRGLERGCDDDEWRRVTEAAGEGLRALSGEAEVAAAEMADSAVFRLHDAVTDLLSEASRVCPLVVVLDDLHWADVASLKLLEFVVRHTWFERLLVIGTLRDVEVASADHPLREPVAALQAKATSITLTGLDASEVSALMERATGKAPDGDLAADVHRRTGGNPFFVEQLASLWHSGGSLDAIPPGLESVLELRLAQLPSRVVDRLVTAAVLGREFETGLLADAVGADPDDLTTDLRIAEAARLVTPTTNGGFSFVHDLIRETLRGRLDPDAMRKQHARVVATFERLPPAEVSKRRSDLAAHAVRAVPEVPAEQALQHLLHAADDACGRVAADEVAQHLRAAIDLVPEHEQERRAAIAVDLGLAQHASGALAEARATFSEVLQTARASGEARLLARAVLGLHGLGIPDPDEQWQEEIALLDEAGDALAAAGTAEGDPLAVRVGAASLRARSHLLAGDEVREQDASDLLELARRTGEDEVLGFALLARHDAIWRPGTAPERVELSDEMAAVALRHGDVEGELQALLLRMVALLELGDPRSLEVQADLARKAARGRLPRYDYLARTRQASIDLLQGRFDQARVGIDAALELGERLDEVDRSRLWLEQRWALALFQGDFDEAKALLARYHAMNDSYVVVPEAVTAALSGDDEVVRHHAPRIATLGDDYPTMFAPALLHARAVVAAATGDPSRCEAAREALAPYRDLWIVVAGGGSIYGPYVQQLARLDVAQRRWGDAIHTFQAAIVAAERLAARPWVLHAQVGLIGALLGRGTPADLVDADVLLPEVAEEAADLGMKGVHGDAQRLRERVDEARRGLPASPPRLGPAVEGPQVDRSRDAMVDSQFRFDGTVWTLTFAGRTVRMPPAKGLRDIHTLLTLPGVDVPAVDLLDPEGGVAVQVTKRLGGDAILDDEARSRYRQRLTDLDDAIERATARHEDARAAELDTERQAILDELRRATGLGGRARRLGDEAERARKTVTARIRDALRRLDEHHPELAEHLRASVSTGASCRYESSREVAWAL